jgi:hypothetical protein
MSKPDYNNTINTLLQDAETGRKWRENSSLEVWFPFTAEELESIKKEASELREKLRLAEVAKQCNLDALHKACADLQRTREQLAESKAYADKLAAGLPHGLLPKDVEGIRDANAKFAQEVHDLQGWNAAQKKVLVRLCEITGVGDCCEDLITAVERLKKYTDDWVVITPERVNELNAENARLQKKIANQSKELGELQKLNWGKGERKGWRQRALNAEAAETRLKERVAHLEGVVKVAVGGLSSAVGISDADLAEAF